MAKPKTGMKVTFNISQDLLNAADGLARNMGLDRYDVLRLAITQGLVVVAMQRELAADVETYRRDLVDLVMRGDDTAANRIAANFELSIERQASELEAILQRQDEVKT